MEEVQGEVAANNEETKVSKTGKRGRPRKNPLVVKEESSSKMSKRGRKPKKLYDIDPNSSKGGINVTFNESENKEDSENYSIHDNEFHKTPESPMGPIEKNLKMADSHNFSFDSMANFGKNDNYPSNHLPFYPRKQSTNNPFDKFFSGVPQNLDYMNNDQRSRRVSSVLSPYQYPMGTPNIVSPSPIRKQSFNVDFKSKGYTMGIANQSSSENQANKQLGELIAQSFKSFNNKPPRKETEEIDFSANDNPILNILNSSLNGNGQKKTSQFEFLSNSILSP